MSGSTVVELPLKLVCCPVCKGKRGATSSCACCEGLGRVVKARAEQFLYSLVRR
jgi:hypothetical protein